MKCSRIFGIWVCSAESRFGYYILCYKYYKNLLIISVTSFYRHFFLQAMLNLSRFKMSFKVFQTRSQLLLKNWNGRTRHNNRMLRNPNMISIWTYNGVSKLPLIWFFSEVVADVFLESVLSTGQLALTISDIEHLPSSAFRRHQPQSN